MHEIETNERRLTLLKELGRGAFARVSLASFNGAKVAVKSVALSDETAAAMASNEIDVLDWLARRGVVGVVKLRDVIETPGFAHLVLDLVPGTELFAHLARQPASTLPVSEIRNIIKQLLITLSRLHAAGILHRDVKLDNILYDPSTGSATLIDFNLSSFFNPSTTFHDAVGSLIYASPSILRCAAFGEPYGAEGGSHDVWALGVAAFGMLCGVWPFFAQQDPLALLQELETSAGQNLKFYNLNPTTLQESYETELAKDFIRTILNPRDPVTAEQALLHPWFDADEEGLPPLPRAPPGSPVDWPDAETEGENEFVSFEDRDFELGASEETESGSLAGSETEDEKDGLELPGLALEISNISLGSPRKQRASLRSRADSVGTLFALCG